MLKDCHGNRAGRASWQEPSLAEPLGQGWPGEQRSHGAGWEPHKPPHDRAVSFLRRVR